MFSIYLLTGELAVIGPGGKPYASEEYAQASAKDRNKRAEEMGLSARYEVGPAALNEK